jgi:hypothetical protein
MTNPIKKWLTPLILGVIRKSHPFSKAIECGVAAVCLFIIELQHPYLVG